MVLALSALGGPERRTFLVTPPSFLGAAFFLVTPVGFAAVFLVVEAALVDLGLVFVRLTAGAVSTTGKTRGLELPVAERVPSRAIPKSRGVCGLDVSVSASH